jgi:hypothetical protein
VLMDVPTLVLGLLAASTFKLGGRPSKPREQPAT